MNENQESDSKPNEAPLENRNSEPSTRRNLFRKLLTLAGLGITGVLLSENSAGLLPKASAASVTTSTSNTANQIAFWDGATPTTDITGDSNLTWTDPFGTGGQLFVTGSSDAGTTAIIANGGSGIAGSTNTAGGIGVQASSNSNSGIPLLVEASGGTNQTANLQEWRNYPNLRLSVVDPRGFHGIGTTSPQYGLHIVMSGATAGIGPLTAASSPPGNAPNSFICQNNTPGNAKSQFTFRDNTGANRYSFGNDSAGSGSQNFFIYDEVAHVLPLTIDSSGHVHIMDLVFANGVRATEDSGGLAFKNRKGTKIAFLDENGNLQVKGKITENPNL